MPVVSVIIPTYGAPTRLGRAVESVLAQTFSDLELIVVDDNSPETAARAETAALMEKFVKADARIQYLRHERNKNGAAARNTGIRAAAGAYVSFLDSDDEYLPERIEKCLSALKASRNEKAQGVYTGCEYRQDGRTHEIYTDVVCGSFLTETLKMSFNLYTGSNIFVSRAALEALKGFDEAFIRHQDVEFIARFFMKYEILGIQEVLVIKNLGGSNKPNAEKMESIKTLFLDTFRETIDSLPPRERREIVSEHHRQIAEAFLKEKKYKRALGYYARVARHRCLRPRYIARALRILIRQ